MINMNFWKLVKEKWIRDNDPTVDATEELIEKSSKTQEEIDKLNEQLNGLSMDFDSVGSLDDINNMMNQLNDLGVDEIPFDALFNNSDET